MIHNILTTEKVLILCKLKFGKKIQRLSALYENELVLSLPFCRFGRFRGFHLIGGRDGHFFT